MQKMEINSKPTSKGNHKELLLSLFIFTYLFYLIAWLSPENETRKRIIEPINTAWLFFGLDQNWKLFSPEIKDINFHTVAILTFEDGTKKIWELPRMKRLDFWQRFKDEKFRKWSIDSLPWPDYKEFHPDFAVYVAKKFYDPAKSPKNKPVSLSLQLFWIDIPDPAKHFTKVENLPEHTRMNNVFFYRFKEGDLQ